MKKLKTVLSGRVRLQISGIFLERFLNLCVRRGLPTWDIRRQSETELLLTTTPAAFARMRDAAFRAGVRVRVASKEGLPFRLRPFRKRFALLAGLLLFLLLPLAASQFLWTIHLEGCETLEPTRVLQTLEQLGLKKGALLWGLDTQDIELAAQLQIKELSFIAINLKGTEANIQVRERTPAPAPLDPEGWRDMAADRDGLIVSTEVYDGVALVARGDTVRKGDRLISGAVPNSFVGTRYVAADGTVTARTWHSGAIEAKRLATARWPTGRERKRYTLMLGDFSLKLGAKSGISSAEYDTLYEEHPIRLPFGASLPLRLGVETLREMAVVSRVQSDEELRALCLARLEDVKQALAEGGAEVEAADCTVEISKDRALLRFEITCLEQIAVPVPPALPAEGGDGA
ncbi:MAG: sporulation protein YqfD [Clostridia bacterium]|nr:sporulation protein YqfD [Clostridia bacterium]